MTTTLNQKIKETVKNYIIEELNRARKNTKITDDEPLLTSGLLDSLFLVDLLLFIEETFDGVQISLETVTRDELNSINAISELIQKKLSP